MLISLKKFIEFCKAADLSDERVRGLEIIVDPENEQNSRWYYYTGDLEFLMDLTISDHHHDLDVELISGYIFEDKYTADMWVCSTNMLEEYNNWCNIP